MDKIGAILDEVQRIPSASGKAFIVKLNKLLLLESEESQENILKAIWRGCLDQCLLCAKKEHVVDKMIEFLGSFISAKSTIDMAYTSCIDHLTLRSKATNKVVRFRSSQMVLRIIVGTMDSDKLVSEATLKKMCDMLRPRLRDKFPNVRVIALRALGNLQSDCDGINKEILQLLQRDSSKEVRIAAIDCICLSKDTLPILIARVKDVKPEVRIAVYSRLSAKGAVNAKVTHTLSLILETRSLFHFYVRSRMFEQITNTRYDNFEICPLLFLDHFKF